MSYGVAAWGVILKERYLRMSGICDHASIELRCIEGNAMLHKGFLAMLHETELQVQTANPKARVRAGESVCSSPRAGAGVNIFCKSYAGVGSHL